MAKNLSRCSIEGHLRGVNIFPLKRAFAKGRQEDQTVLYTTEASFYSNMNGKIVSQDVCKSLRAHRGDKPSECFTHHEKQTVETPSYYQFTISKLPYLMHTRELRNPEKGEIGGKSATNLYSFDEA